MSVLECIRISMWSGLAWYDLWLVQLEIFLQPLLTVMNCTKTDKNNGQVTS